MWYSYNQIRTYNCCWNFIMSNRGGGKTYGAKLLGIKDFLKTGEQFIYVRRYDSELDDRGLFFNDLIANGEFEGHEFKVEGYTGYCDGEPMVYFVALSTSLKLKSIPYPKVTKIIYDEFIVPDPKYLKLEVFLMKELYKTVDRDQDRTDMFFLGNSISFINPFFTDLNININPSRKFTRNKSKTAVVELFADPEHIQRASSTRFGKSIEGTEYADYSINNKSLTDNNSFIKKRPSGNLRFICSFKLDGFDELGLWLVEGTEELYMDKKLNPQSKNRYSITKENHTPQYTVIDKVKKSKIIDRTKLAFQTNNLYFENSEVKKAYFTLLKYI